MMIIDGQEPPDALEELERRVDIVNRQLKVMRRDVIGSKGNKAFERAQEEIKALVGDYDPVQSSVIYILFLLPVVGFFGYPMFSSALRDLFEAFVSFKAVDGNAFAAELLRPTVNGVIVPACAITFGTLLATTVNVLRNRQVEMRACISKEACQLRLLRRAIFGMFGTAQHAARRKTALELVLNYTRATVIETREFAFDELSAIEEEGGSVSVNQLEEIAAMLHGIEGAAASRDFSVNSAQATLVNLNELRSDRLASLQSGFPVIHWIILGLLATSIVLLFMVDSNQDVLQYLNSLQLRLLFSILLTTFSATAGLCLDLADPFRGVTTINSAARQLVAVQLTIEADLAEVEADLQAKGYLSGSSRQLLDSRYPRYNQRLHVPQESWGIADTVYFHMLTGKPGSTVRMLGDVAAWVGRRRPRFRSSNRRVQADVAAHEDEVAPGAAVAAATAKAKKASKLRRLAAKAKKVASRSR
jgi:hypothetical protein